AGVPVALLGSQVTHTPEYVLKESRIDFAVRGEPEYTLRTLVSALEQGGDPKTIAGLSYWQDGLPVHNPAAEMIQDLDALPFPARHLLPNELYNMPDMEKPFTTVQSSRGCPLNCSYCGYTLSQGLKWRGRSAENVVEEVSEVYKKYGVRSVVFRDPLFSYKMDRVAEICDLLVTRKIEVKWQCETAIRYLDRDLLLQMGRAGCVSVSLGVESVDPEIQKNYSKGKLKSTDHAREITRACREAGIRTRIFFMLGFPEDTRDTIRDTVEFACELDPDSVQFTAVTPYPGTRLHERLKDTCNISYEDLWGYKPVGICRNLSNRELEQEIKRAFKRFYMRPGRLLKAALHPGTLARRLKRYLGLYR
ncbi:MAG: radical SAM protein, partial [Planctomycetes bacterium]|nr:radical SAM protein [Planctomycetota bacterium]